MIKIREMPNLNVSERNRFISKIAFSRNCWNLTSGNKGNGYCDFSFRGKSYPAHRISYEIFSNEKVPTDKVIDHLCKNPSCVNPFHLEIVTDVENVLRGNAPSAKNKRKIYCEHGHILSGDNLYIRSDGRGRQCKKCRANAMIQVRIRKKLKHHK